MLCWESCELGPHVDAIGSIRSSETLAYAWVIAFYQEKCAPEAVKYKYCTKNKENDWTPEKSGHSEHKVPRTWRLYCVYCCTPKSLLSQKEEHNMVNNSYTKIELRRPFCHAFGERHSTELAKTGWHEGQIIKWKSTKAEDKLASKRRSWHIPANIIKLRKSEGKNSWKTKKVIKTV